MNESAYYPAGAYYDKAAPYNQLDVPEEEFEVTCSQSLSRTTTVVTNNYVPGDEGVDWETDDEGHPCKSHWQDAPDTSDTNWAEEYHDNDHYTPIQLIELFKQCLEENLKNGLVFKNPKVTQRLIEECKGWIENETEYVEG